MSTIPSADLKALHAERDRLQAILDTEQPDSFERRKIILAHRVLTDLINADGGSPEYRGSAMRRLTEIHAIAECPRVAASNVECPLCHAVDDKNHEDNPRECPR